MPIRLLVVDDHSMVRQGLQMFFEGDPQVEIVGEARNGEEALHLAQSLAPHVILMDLLMPAMDGVEATRRLRSLLPHVPVVAMTSVVEESGIHRAIEAGAIGYVLKDTRPDELRASVLAAAEGRVCFAKETAGRLMREVRTPVIDPQTLSDQERLVLRLMADGRSRAEIGCELGCSEEEVEACLARVLDRLQLAGWAQAVLYAARQGLVPPESHPYLV